MQMITPLHSATREDQATIRQAKPSPTVVGSTKLKPVPVGAARPKQVVAGSARLKPPITAVVRQNPVTIPGPVFDLSVAIDSGAINEKQLIAVLTEMCRCVLAAQRKQATVPATN